MVLSVYYSNLARLISILFLTQFLNCEPQPVHGSSPAAAKEIQYKITVNEVVVIGIPIQRSGIRQLIIGNTILYSDCLYQREKGNVLFQNPISDTNGYTGYFSQKVSARLMGSDRLELIFSPHSLHSQQAGVLTHHLVITEMHHERKKGIQLRSASIISRGGTRIITVIIDAQIQIEDPRMIMPLIDEVTDRVTEKLLDQEITSKKQF